jgi:hypothetical protein
MTGTVLTSEIALSTISMYPDYKLFKIATEELQKTKIEDLNEEEKKVFWLNIFNVLSLHSHIHLCNKYKVNNQKYLSKFFTKTSYLIGSFKFSISDIFFGIFRKNFKISNFKFLPKQFFKKYLPWKENDPRHSFSLSSPFPLSTFALCFSFVDSPFLQIYHQEEQFDQVKKIFFYFFNKFFFLANYNDGCELSF